MTPSDPKEVVEPEPSGVICECGHDADYHMRACWYNTAKKVCNCEKSAFDVYKSTVLRLRSERDEAQKERDALAAEARRLHEIINRTLVGALSVLHGGKVEVRKLEVDTQPEKLTP